MVYKVWYSIKKCPNCNHILSRKRRDGECLYDTRFKRCPSCKKIIITGNYLFDDYTKEEIKENEQTNIRIWIITFIIIVLTPLIGGMYNMDIIPDGFITFWILLILFMSYMSLSLLFYFLRDCSKTFGRIVKKKDKELYDLELLVTYYIDNGINRIAAVKMAYEKYLNGDNITDIDFDKPYELGIIDEAVGNKIKNDKRFKCDNCGAVVPGSSKECPNCGELFEDELSEEYDDIDELYEKAEEYRNSGYTKRAREAYTKYADETEKLMKESEDKCFTFGNSIEFVLAVKKELTGGKCKDMDYRTSDAYLNLAAMAFDDKDYDVASKYLNKSVKYNPINIASLFEMAEIYKAKGDLEKFLSWTEKCYDRLYYISQLAHYYRNLGYYYIEKKKWKLAQAVYLYSLKYEDNSIVDHELEYISQKTNNDELPKKDELSTILRENDIPTFINKENLKIIKDFHKSLEEKNQLNTNVGKFVTKIIKDNANL